MSGLQFHCCCRVSLGHAAMAVLGMPGTGEMVGGSFLESLAVVAHEVFEPAGKPFPVSREAGERVFLP